MGEIAARARLSKQTLTSLVRQMERDGLVRREPDPDDGRASIVTLTPRAEDARVASEGLLRDLDARVAEHLTRRTTETVREALRRLMTL